MSKRASKRAAFNLKSRRAAFALLDVKARQGRTEPGSTNPKKGRA